MGQTRGRGRVPLNGDGCRVMGNDKRGACVVVETALGIEHMLGARFWGK